MLDMSWGEVMVIGAVALIVIGPKDLPKALRTVGQMTAKVRRMAAEFQGQFNEAMREAELDDVKRQIQGVNDSVGGFNPMQTIRDELKGAVETPVTGTPGITVSDAPPVVSDQPNPTAPVEPASTLVVPELPPIGDPADSIAAAVRPPEPVEAAKEPVAAETSSEKA